MNNFIEGWYLAYTKPKHEKKVFEKLMEKQINSYLPTVKKVRKWSDRKKIIEEPLFPSYVFIYLKDASHYFTSLEQEGVLFYVRFGKKIARVNDDIVNNIKLVASHGYQLETSTDRLYEGQRIIIQDGPLTGLSCEMVRYKGKEKILVRVNLLNQNILADIPAQSVALA